LWRELRQCDCAQSQKSAAQWKLTNPTSTLTLRLSFCTVPCPCLYIARQQLQHLSCSPLAAVSAQSCARSPHPSWPASKSTAPAASAQCCTCTHRQITCKARVESRRRTPARIGARPPVLSSSAIRCTLQRRAPPRSCSVLRHRAAIRHATGELTASQLKRLPPATLLAPPIPSRHALAWRHGSAVDCLLRSAGRQPPGTVCSTWDDPLATDTSRRRRVCATEAAEPLRLALCALALCALAL
jgi:hypothetical protein